MSKYRKKFTKEEAESAMESIRQSISVNNEHLWYITTQKQTQTDRLIQSITGFKTKEETIEMIEKELKNLWEKYEYCKKFSPDYKTQGSFGIF